MESDFKIDFVGVGAPKCATTWIYECLQEHPDICVSKTKEANIFRDLSLSNKLLSINFSHCLKGQIKGEFSPQYIINSDVAELIKMHNPDAKLIVSLRSPIERAFSHFLHASSLQHKNWQNFRDALEKDPDIIEFGFYYKNLQSFLKLFPREQVLILIFEDIGKDPNGFIKKICEFLEVDSSFRFKKTQIKVSPTSFKLTKFGRFLHKSIGIPLKRNSFTKKIKKSVFIRNPYLKLAELYTKNVEKPAIKKEDFDFLKEYYIPDINQLEKLIDRDLSFWVCND